MQLSVFRRPEADDWMPQAVWPSAPGRPTVRDYTRSFYLLTQLKYPFYLTSLTDALIFPPSSLHGFKPHARLFATDIGDWWSTTLPQVIQIKRFTFYHQATLERGTFAQARLLYSYMWTHPGKKLLFMGCEFGQWKEWNYDDGLDWTLLNYDDTHGGLQRCVADLNRIYQNEPALHELDFEWQGFEWIDCDDWEESVYSYIRKAKEPEDHIVVILNFTPVPRRKRFGVPANVDYQEIFCSDAPIYGGSGCGNGCVRVGEVPCNSKPYSIEVLVPPLGATFLKPVKAQEANEPELEASASVDKTCCLRETPSD